MNSFHKYFFKKAFVLTGAISACIWMAACTSETNAEQTKANSDTTQESMAPAAKPTPTPSENGIGPINKVDLASAPDQAMADTGKDIFESKCAACHKFGERYVGPDLAGIATRRKPEWIMNMILNPQEMTQKDATAQELIGQFMTQMPNQNLTEEEARAVLEYFRTK